MKRVNIHLTKEQIQKLKNLSASLDVSVAKLVRHAVDKYLRG